MFTCILMHFYLVPFFAWFRSWIWVGNVMETDYDTIWFQETPTFPLAVFISSTCVLRYVLIPALILKTKYQTSMGLFLNSKVIGMQFEMAVSKHCTWLLVFFLQIFTFLLLYSLHSPKMANSFLPSRHLNGGDDVNNSSGVPSGNSRLHKCYNYQMIW